MNVLNGIVMNWIDIGINGVRMRLFMWGMKKIGRIFHKTRLNYSLKNFAKLEGSLIK